MSWTECAGAPNAAIARLRLWRNDPAGAGFPAGTPQSRNSLAADGGDTGDASERSAACSTRFAGGSSGFLEHATTKHAQHTTRHMAVILHRDDRARDLRGH